MAMARWSVGRAALGTHRGQHPHHGRGTTNSHGGMEEGATKAFVIPGTPEHQDTKVPRNVRRFLDSGKNENIEGQQDEQQKHDAKKEVDQTMADQASKRLTEPTIGLGCDEGTQSDTHGQEPLFKEARDTCEPVSQEWQQINYGKQMENRHPGPLPRTRQKLAQLGVRLVKATHVGLGRNDGSGKRSRANRIPQQRRKP